MLWRSSFSMEEFFVCKQQWDKLHHVVKIADDVWK
jgi:hypothetical protein